MNEWINAKCIHTCKEVLAAWYLDIVAQACQRKIGHNMAVKMILTVAFILSSLHNKLINIQNKTTQPLEFKCLWKYLLSQTTSIVVA